MPEAIPKIDTRLSPEQMAATQRAADEVNTKHKIEGKKYGESLDKDSFLKLLLTELSHQDPTAPMQDKEFIAQMAQFSSLEQMNKIGSEMNAMNVRSSTQEAYSMLGKKIQAFDPITGRVTEGNVDSIKRDGDRVFLMVGNNPVNPNNVSAVFQADPIAPQGFSYGVSGSNNTPARADYARAEAAYSAETQENTKGSVNKLINFKDYYDNKKGRENTGSK